tara:strand:+ start:349 stop:741 length:393 start_codon:yes stop_codon:yes gene_type:complete
MQTFKTFKDLSVTFKKHPMTDDLLSVKDKAAIKQSIMNLLLTQKRERLFNPDLGSAITQMLFEPLDYASAAIIQVEIANVLNDYEPRIQVLNVLCKPDIRLDGFNVEVHFEITGRNDAPQQINFVLERTR